MDVLVAPKFSRTFLKELKARDVETIELLKNDIQKLFFLPIIQSILALKTFHIKLISQNI